MLIAMSIFGLYDPVTACHPTTFDFFASRDPIDPNLCEPDANAIATSFQILRLIEAEFSLEAANLANHLETLGIDPTDRTHGREDPVGCGNVQAQRTNKYTQTAGWNFLLSW